MASSILMMSTRLPQVRRALLSLAAIVVVAGSWATPASGETFPVRFVAGEDRSQAAAESLPEAWLVLQEEGEEGAARFEARSI